MDADASLLTKPEPEPERLSGLIWKAKLNELSNYCRRGETAKRRHYRVRWTDN